MVKTAKKRWKKFLVVFLLLHVVVFFTAHYSFSKSPEKLYARALKHKPYDAIIVPGVPYNGQEWDRIMEARVLWSKYLYDAGIAKNIIYSGSAVQTAYVEGKVMALYAEKLGIPKEHIFIEDRALHSVENLYYSYGVARDLDFKTLAVATDPYQSSMLGSFIWQWGLKMDRISIVKPLLDSMKVPDVAAIDFSSAMVKDFVPLSQKENRWQRLKGTIGSGLNFNNIPSSNYAKHELQPAASTK